MGGAKAWWGAGCWARLGGRVVGALLMGLAHYYRPDLMGAAAEATATIPLLPDLLDPDRWLFWLGIIFILLVYFFPKGIAGTAMAGGTKS